MMLEELSDVDFAFWEKYENYCVQRLDPLMDPLILLLHALFTDVACIVDNKFLFAKQD